MKLYNTEIRKKEEIKGKSLKMYVCGPTVYDRAHIGNLRTYINVDTLRRTLGYLGYQVKYVMNITDIEDKIIAKAQTSGTGYQEITKEYESLFWDDLKKLNILKPDETPHATDQKVIAEMVKIIEKLIADGYAYVADDNSTYFNVVKYNNYGKLSHLDKKGIKAGARVAQDEYGKENPQDFALWKAAKEGEPSWKGPLGIVGRPGWHIECSAMSMLYLGETIDIHAGGVDLVFPHHENEIAQSEAYTGMQFVRHWFHGEHLMVEGKKMSKSLGNLFSLDELVEEYTIDPLAFRLLCLQSGYRDKLNFTAQSIKDAQNTLSNLRNFVTRASQMDGNVTDKSVRENIAFAKKEFRIALEDDLNTCKALAVIFQFITDTNKLLESNRKGAKEILRFIAEIDEVLALNLDPEKAGAEVHKLFDQYREARTNKSWDESDRIRKQIADLGWIVEDTKCDSILRKK